MSVSLKNMCRAASKAARGLAIMDTSQKNGLLMAMADELLSHGEEILAANALDVGAAREDGLSEAMCDRLLLTPSRLASMAEALRQVAGLPDPVGDIFGLARRPNGLLVGKMRIPLGVVAIIYESRPNVTSDAAGLCLKSGNGVVLRGGSEAFRSNQAIVGALRKGIEKAGGNPDVVAFVSTTDRTAMLELLKLTDDIDLVIPRGGEGLIRFVVENSRIPVIQHYKGICHLYVDREADWDMAIRILLDGKTSRPGVCNALETLLVHRDIAEGFLKKAGPALALKNVRLHGCPGTRAFLPDAVPAREEDFDMEYLSLDLSCRIVSDFAEAIDHIEKHGSRHTDVIVTENIRTARRFLRDVSSSSVMVNASSRFADGGELGLGAEIGISTTKLHAYGPMGLEALTIAKFVVLGDGQIRHPEGAY